MFSQKDLTLLGKFRNLHPREYYTEMAGMIGDETIRTEIHERVATARDMVYRDGGWDSFYSQTNEEDVRALSRKVSRMNAGFANKLEKVLERDLCEYHLFLLRSADPQLYLDTLRVIDEPELLMCIADATVVNDFYADGTPASIPLDEDVSGAFLGPTFATAAVEGATLLRLLNELSSPNNELPYNAKGLRLSRVAIVGDPLDLSWLNIPFPVAFLGCEFYSGIEANHTELPMLKFDQCDFMPDGAAPWMGGQFNAADVTITGDLSFWGCTGLKQLFIYGADIGVFQPRVQDSEHSIEVSAAAFRTVIDEASFGTLYIPADIDIPFELKHGVQIERVIGDYGDIVAWLRKEDCAPEAWDTVANALVRSGRGKDAKRLRIASEQFKYKSRNPVVRFMAWLFLGLPSAYLQKPGRTVWVISAVFTLTWVLAFISHDVLVQAPTAGTAVPANWLSEAGPALVWTFVYALDNTFPPLSLGQAEVMWPASVVLTATFAALRAISLVLLGVLVASATELVSKKSGADLQ